MPCQAWEHDEVIWKLTGKTIPTLEQEGWLRIKANGLVLQGFVPRVGRGWGPRDDYDEVTQAQLDTIMDLVSQANGPGEKEGLLAFLRKAQEWHSNRD